MLYIYCMKQRLFSLLLSLLALQLHAQVTITYERKINMHRTIRNPEFAAMVPEYRVSKQELLVRDSVSLYRNIVEMEQDNAAGGDEEGGTRRVFTMGGPGGGENTQIYKNTSDSKLLEQRELGGKMFLISDTLKPLRWKLTNDTATIGGYLCKKATMMRDTIPVNAWYAPQLATASGPDTYYGLPGTILKVDVNRGLTVYTAIAIKQGVDDKSLKEPSKGSKVTRAEYRDKQRQLMENMRNMRNNGGRIMIQQ